MNITELNRRLGGSIIPEGTTVTKILLDATVNHRGWEMDNDMWLVELSDGERVILGTNHGGICQVTDDEFEEFIKSTKDSLDSLMAIKAAGGNS